MAVWIGVVQAHRSQLSFAAVTRYAQQFFRAFSHLMRSPPCDHDGLRFLQAEEPLQSPAT